MEHFLVKTNSDGQRFAVDQYYNPQPLRKDAKRMNDLCKDTDSKVRYTVMSEDELMMRGITF
jgi:hypothetical protein